MMRIAAEVAVYETKRKQAESEPTRGYEIEVLTEQRATAHSSHIIDGPPRRCLFRALPSRAGIGWQVQYHECAGHQRQVVVGTEIPLRSRFRIVLHCRRLNGRSNVRVVAEGGEHVQWLERDPR